MAAHRYWRASVETGVGLAISEFQLIVGTTRVDATATLTSSVAPVSGSLANLKDDDVSTDATWSTTRGLIFTWDFGSGGDVDVSDIRLGSMTDRKAFPYAVRLQYSDDNTTWVLADIFSIIVWPGYRAKTISEQLGNLLKAHGLAGGATTTQYVPTSPFLTAEVGDYGSVVAPISVNTGIRQVEFSKVSIFGAGIASDAFGFATTEAIRLANPNGAPQSGAPPMTRQGAIAYYLTGFKYINGSPSAFGASFTTGDVIGATLNFSTGAVTFYKNGVSQGVAGSFPVGQPDIQPMIGVFGSSGFANRNVQALRTRGFTYPIVGAVPWEDRYRIATAYGPTTAGSFLFGKVATAAERTSFAVKGIKAPYRLWRDFRDPILGTGRGRVKGTTKDKGSPNVPVSERVRLYREQDGALVREVLSAPVTGAYSFDYVDELQVYTVISYDHDKNFRAVVADNLTLVGGGVELIA